MTKKKLQFLKRSLLLYRDAGKVLENRTPSIKGSTLSNANSFERRETNLRTPKGFLTLRKRFSRQVFPQGHHTRAATAMVQVGSHLL